MTTKEIDIAIKFPDDTYCQECGKILIQKLVSADESNTEHSTYHKFDTTKGTRIMRWLHVCPEKETAQFMRGHSRYYGAVYSVEPRKFQIALNAHKHEHDLGK